MTGELCADFDQCSAVVDDVARLLLDDAGITEPPVDVFLLAERLQITVAVDAAQQSRGRHKQLAGASSIFLRPEERPERLQWAAAHEVGEVVAWRIFERLEIDSEPLVREQIANLTASRLLLPSCWFFDDVRTVERELLELKTIYSTASHELIALRMLDLPEPSIVTVFDHRQLTRRQASREMRAPRIQPIERECWQRVHSHAEPHTMQSETLEVRGWPIHETGWKREILRTTPVE